MSDIKWGETHCLVCEKPFAKDADYDEGYRLEQTYGVDSQPVQEFDARLCWGDCYEFDTILKRLGDLLAERDTLRAENARLTRLLFERETILPNGELGVMKEHDTLRAENDRLQATEGQPRIMTFFCPGCGQKAEIAMWKIFCRQSCQCHMCGTWCRIEIQFWRDAGTEL